MLYDIEEERRARQAAAMNRQPLPKESIPIRITSTEQRATIEYAFHVISEECNLNLLKLSKARREGRLPANGDRLTRAFIQKMEAARKLRFMTSRAKIGETLEVHTKFFLTDELEVA